MNYRVVGRVERVNEPRFQMCSTIRGVAVLPNGYSLELTRVRNEMGCRYFLDSGTELPYVTSFVPRSPMVAGRDQPEYKHEPNKKTTIRIRL